MKKFKPSDEIDELLAMGQDSEDKAVKYVQEQNDRVLLEAAQKDAQVQQKLHDKRKNENLYRDALKNEAKRRISEYDIPLGYQIDCVLTSKGLAFGWRSSLSKLWFMKGMQISGLVAYDLPYIDRLINQALQEIGNKEQNKDDDHLTAGGVVIPGGK